MQMTCAIWGKKCNFNIFQSSGICWVCSTLANEQQDFSVVAPIWQSNCIRNSSKVAEVIHELEFAMYLVESSFTLLKQWGLLYLPITSEVNFSVALALQPSRTVTLCFDFVSPWQQSPLYVNVFLGWRL